MKQRLLNSLKKQQKKTIEGLTMGIGIHIGLTITKAIYNKVFVEPSIRKQNK